MTSAKTLSDFEHEFEELRKKLGELGHVPSDRDHGTEAGLKGDFELPYSTLPKLRGDKWNQSAKIA